MDQNNSKYGHFSHSVLFVLPENPNPAQNLLKNVKKIRNIEQVCEISISNFAYLFNKLAESYFWGISWTVSALSFFVTLSYLLRFYSCFFLCGHPGLPISENALDIFRFYSWVVWQLLRQLACVVSNTIYQVSFFLWWIRPVLKLCKTQKYYP